MGVFYNPQGAMPIAQMGYSSQISGASGVSGRPTKGRDVNAEKFDYERAKEAAFNKAVVDGKGDIDSTVLSLEQIDAPKAQVWEKSAYESRKSDSEFRMLKAKNQVEMARLASEVMGAGDTRLGNEIAQSIDPNIKAIRNTKNPDMKEIDFIGEGGKTNTQVISVNALIKAGTDSATQFQAQAEMDRLLISYSEKNPEATIAKDKAKVFNKMKIAQTMGAQFGGNMDKAVEAARKQNLDIEFTPAEVDLYVVATHGTLMTAAIQAKNANPEYIKIWDSKKTGKTAAEFIADNDMQQLELMKKAFIKNLGVRMKGEDSLPPPKDESKKDVDVTISSTTKSHPTANPKNITVVKNGKKLLIKNTDAARKWATDNKYTVE